MIPMPFQTVGAVTPLWSDETELPEIGGIATEEGRWLAEKRYSARRALNCTVQMLPLASDQQPHPADAISGDCLNISDTGLYATVAIGYGMAVGQRYVLRLRTRELGPEGPQLVLRIGIITRTELVLGAGADQVGVGVRFCGQRSPAVESPEAIARA